MTPRRQEEPSPAPKKRRVSKRRSPKKPDLPAQLSQVNLNAAAIDIGSRSHFAAVPFERSPKPVQEFGSFTADLYALADWLEECGIETVVMESTGVYWIPLMEVLEERGFEALLVDSHQIKQVPGRKTDVCDAQWLQTLHTFGLLRGAFRPADQVCALRSYLRQRSRLVSDASRHIQHMQKALEQMNVKLTNVVSNVAGMTGMRIQRAIANGEQDPKKLAALRDSRCKESEETIALALEGHWRDEHLFELRQALTAYDFSQQQIVECDECVEEQLKGLTSHTEEPAPSKKGVRVQGNAPSFDVREHLYRLTGVDLTNIDGVDAYSMLLLVGEIGLDMTRWPSDKHFSAWLGLCPGNHITGGKSHGGQPRRCANRAAKVLRLCANSLHRSNSALGACFRRYKARLGAPAAITATAHKLARIIYAMLTKGTEYVDIGQQAYTERYQQRAMANLRRNASRLGFKLVKADTDAAIEATATAAA